MCKRLLICLLVLLLLPSAPAHAEAARFALLYDGQSTTLNETVDILRSYMLYASWDCDYFDVWEEHVLDDYDGIILCIGENQVMPRLTREILGDIDAAIFVLGGGGLQQIMPEAVYAEGDVMLRVPSENGTDSDMLLTTPGLWLLSEEGRALGEGKIFVDGTGSPLCRNVGRVTHFAWFDPAEPLLCAQLASCLQRWQWPYENAPTAFGHYLVLDYAYPFLEPADLMARTDLLKKEGIPYAIAVTPIFNNGDYPAMKRFCELLRYEQNCGTGIIIRVPFVNIDGVVLDELIHHMNIAYEAYATYGVYPLAVQAPVSWLMTEKGLEALRGYRTVFLFESEEDLTRPHVDRNIAYADGHQIIAPAWSDYRAFSASYAQGIYLDAEMDMEELTKLVQRLKNSNRAFKSLGSMENAVYSGDFAVLGESDGNISVNGVRQDLTYTPFTYEDDYTFDRGFTQYLKDQIETSNQWVMMFVIVSCTIFIAMMFLFRRQIRRELVLGMPKRKMQTPKTKNKDETTSA